MPKKNLQNLFSKKNPYFFSHTLKNTSVFFALAKLIIYLLESDAKFIDLKKFFLVKISDSKKSIGLSPSH